MVFQLTDVTNTKPVLHVLTGSWAVIQTGYSALVAIEKNVRAACLWQYRMALRNMSYGSHVILKCLSPHYLEYKKILTDVSNHLGGGAGSDDCGAVWHDGSNWNKAECSACGYPDCFCWHWCGIHCSCCFGT